MDVVLAFLILIVSFTGALSILVRCVGHWAKDRTFNHSQPRSIIRGLRPAEIVKTDGNLIPMPDNLKTPDEMVVWMTHELPDLVAKTWTAK